MTAGRPIVGLALLALVIALGFQGVTWSRSLPTATATSVITLLKHDPLGQTFSFRAGQHGHVIQDGEVRNWNSDLDFGVYRDGEFSTGIEGDRRGVILDLGCDDDLARAHGYEETVGGGQGFASLICDDGKLRVKSHEVRRSGELLNRALPSEDDPDLPSHAPVRLGHNYVLRVTNGEDPRTQVLVKFRVIAYTPGESVTIRWASLQ